jgi:hypothetical protein
MKRDGRLTRDASSPQKTRLEHELPTVIAEDGWRYHHLGIPTDTPRPGERYLERYGLYVTGFDTSPYGIEWMRWEPSSSVSELIRTVSHIAFEVDDLDVALEGREVIAEPSTPMAGIRVAMIVHDGAPIELMEIDRTRIENEG